MKRVRCPKCDSYITFDNEKYVPGQVLVFECPECKKQFKIRIKSAESKNGRRRNSCHVDRKLIVVVNVFHYKQEFPLYEGINRIGRYVKGSSIEIPIETTDPSMDTLHCIIRVERNKAGRLLYRLQDAPSNTGTFHMSEILPGTRCVNLEDGDIITIGATTLIFQQADQNEDEIS